MSLNRIALFTRHRFLQQSFYSSVMSTPKKARLQESYDLIVIGGGSGGLATAKMAREMGARVCLVDKNLKKLGGTCVNVGCVPKKLFWVEAEKRTNAPTFVKRNNSESKTSVLGSFDWEGFKKSRDDYITKLNSIHAANLAKEGIDVIEGEAKLIDKNTVSITPPDSTEGMSANAKYIVIATGSHPVLPKNIKNYELGITSDDFFKLESQPKKCAIVGGGYVAAELAGIFHALGSDVSVFVRGCCMLGTKFDEMLQKSLTTTMQKNMKLYLNTQIIELEKNDGTITIHTDQHEKLSGFDCVIWAIGRVANLLNSSPLDLGITERGYLDVDQNLRCISSQNERLDTVFGVGDVTGWHMLTPVAIANGRALAKHLFSPKNDAFEKVNEHLIPSVMFTHPPIGTIGFTEFEALMTYGKDEIKVYTRSFMHLNNTFTSDSVKSNIKLITRNCKGEELVIGVHLYGSGVEEVLQAIAIAMQAGVTKQQLDRTIAIHPIGAEEIIRM